MQKVKLLFLVLLTYSLLSCETQKPAVTTSGLGKTSLCGETVVGVTTEKRKFEVAGATLNDFKIGNYSTEVTPEFKKIASDAAMNEQERVKIACYAMEMSGVKPSPEWLTYYLQLLGFLGSSPSPSVAERMAWAEKFPVPKTTPQEQSRPLHRRFGDSVEIELDPTLAKSCKQPTVGLRRQPEYFASIWIYYLRQLRAEKFPQDRDLQNLYKIKDRSTDPYRTPEDFFSESLYTLNCLEDIGQLKLEMLGTTGTYGNKVFENQRIVFSSPP